MKSGQTRSPSPSKSAKSFQAAVASNAHVKNAHERAESVGTLETIKRKLKVAAYDNGFVNWKKLFHHHDLSDTGEIKFEGFKSIIRKDAKVSMEDMNDVQLRALFKHVDKDSSGTVNYQNEFLPWLDPVHLDTHDGVGTGLENKEASWGAMKALMMATHGMCHGVKHNKDDVEKKKERVRGQRQLRMIHLIKKRLTIAAYYNGRINWKKLFRQYDRDNSGEITFDEFRSAIRKDGKVTNDMVSEFDLRKLFNCVDVDRGGSVNYLTEFVPWLEKADPELDAEEVDESTDTRAYKVDEIAMLSRANGAFVKARLCLPFLIKWMNNLLCLRPTDDPDRRQPMKTETFMDDMRDGLHLLHIVRNLSKSADFGGGIYNRCISRPMCESNLEKALAAASRGCVNMGHLCRPSDFYEKRVLQIARCLMCIFDGLQMRHVRKRIKVVLNDMDKLLSPMGRPLHEQVLTKPLEHERYVMTDFGDGTRIMGLLVHAGRAEPADMAKLYGNPNNEEQIRENLKCLNQTLRLRQLPVLLEENEWNSPPAWNFDALWMQLYVLWIAIRDDCADREMRADLDIFKFKDGSSFRHSENDKKAHREKAFQAAKQAHDEITGTTPQSKLSRRFAAFVEKSGGIDAMWKRLDPGRGGSVDMTSFCKVLSSMDFRLDQKRVFEACDVLSNGVVTKDDLGKFFRLATAEAPGVNFEEEEKIMKKKKNLSPCFLDSVFGQKKRHTVTSNDVLEFVHLMSTLGGVEKAYPHFAGSGEDECTMFEFCAACKQFSLVGDPKLVFRQIDISRNGSVSIEEFRDLCKACTYGRFKMELHEGYSVQLLADGPDEGTQYVVLDDEVPVYKSFRNDDISRILVKGESVVAAGEARTVELDGFNFELLPIKPDGFIDVWSVEKGGDSWPSPSLMELLLNDYVGEPRLPGAAEECRSLFEEDTQRQRDLASHGAVSLAQKVRASAEGAMRAVATRSPGEETPELSRLLDQSESTPGMVTSEGPAPTTSLDARIVLKDRTERRVWLQTSVVDRTGLGSNDMADAAFVLEIRDQRNVNSFLHAQVEVAMIQSIQHLNDQVSDPVTTLSSASLIKSTASQEPNANASFVVTALPGADLGGSVDEAEDAYVLWDVCHTGRDGLLTLYIVAGPSPWKRREATKFFDELRIMATFLSEAVGGVAATGRPVGGGLGRPGVLQRQGSARPGQLARNQIRTRQASAPPRVPMAKASSLPLTSMASPSAQPRVSMASLSAQTRVSIASPSAQPRTSRAGLSAPPRASIAMPSASPPSADMQSLHDFIDMEMTPMTVSAPEPKKARTPLLSKKRTGTYK